MFHRCISTLVFVAFLGTGCMPVDIPQPVANTNTPAPTVIAQRVTTPVVPPTVILPEIPYDLISQDSLLAYLEDLTSIQPYSGWRNSASSGEAEALDYVESKLNEFSNLQGPGMELERQSFPVYMSTEIWDSRLVLTVDGREIEVPADGVRGSRHLRPLAAYFDSDGVLGDTNPNPMSADGCPLFVLDDEKLYTLAAHDLEGRILFVDYSLIDITVNSNGAENTGQLIRMMDQGPAGLVLVTHYANHDGESRGTLIGDGSNFGYAIPSARMPVLYVRIEDLTQAGIATWEDLQKIDAAHLLLDSDVLSPGKAGNVIARIPGKDSSRAVILGAHIDSPNGPGAFDDGSGSAALLEIARVLNVSRFQPAVDVYLAWFGGHEIGTYGSAYFVSTHQELLDRTLLEVQMDGLGHPLDSKTSQITIMTNSYGRFGDERTPAFDFLAKAAAPEGVTLDKVVEYGPIADNTNFDAFDVPEVYLGYVNGREWQSRGSTYFHFSNHFHDPYETVDLAREVGDAFVGMTKVMLAAALETGYSQPNLRVTTAEIHRALIVSSHNEGANNTTSMFRDLGMALAWEGFDVDMIPYAQAITSSDLQDVDVIVLPPTLDYPGRHNEKWSDAELALLESYVAAGGLLVVTNSTCNYIIGRCADASNENIRSLNDFLEPMGVRFMFGGFGGDDDNTARPVTEHPLTENARYLTFYEGQGVPFSMKKGTELFRAAGSPIVGLVDYGDKGGQVLVIADLGILQAGSQGAKNIEFLKNIARYAGPP
ncbi:MAG: M28 family peptidase [Bacteroidota bacterium]